MPVESQRRSGVNTVAPGSRITTVGTVFGSANPAFFPAASSVTPTRCAHSAPESVVGTATCAGYPSCRATAFVPSMTLPPPTLTSRSAPADSASPAASSTALPGVCSPMPTCVPAIMPAVYTETSRPSGPGPSSSLDAAAGEKRRLLGDTAAEVPRGGELLLGGLLGAARAVGVAAGLEEHGVRVARGNEDGPPVREHVVQGEERGLLTAVRVLGAGEAADDLVRELALEPQPARRVDELLELRRDVAEPRRRPEDVGVGPLEVRKLGLRHVLGHQSVVGPALVALDGLLRRQLTHLAEPDLGAGLLRALLDGPRQPVHVARRAVVDHRYLGRHLCSFGYKWTRVHFKNGGYRGRLAVSRERGGSDGAITRDAGAGRMGSRPPGSSRGRGARAERRGAQPAGRVGGGAGALWGARGYVRDDGGDLTRRRRRQGHPLQALPEQGGSLPGPARRANPRVPAGDHGARRGDGRRPPGETRPLPRWAGEVHGGEFGPPLRRRGAAVGRDPPGAVPLPRLRLAPVDRARAAARRRTRGGDRPRPRPRVPRPGAPRAAGGGALLPPAAGGGPAIGPHKRRDQVAGAW